jgi:hypothetical protein
MMHRTNVALPKIDLLPHGHVIYVSRGNADNQTDLQRLFEHTVSKRVRRIPTSTPPSAASSSTALTGHPLVDTPLQCGLPKPPFLAFGKTGGRQMSAVRTLPTFIRYEFVHLDRASGSHSGAFA